MRMFYFLVVLFFSVAPRVYSQELRDIKPPEGVGYSFFWLLIALFLAVVIGYYYYYYFMRTKKKKIEINTSIERKSQSCYQIAYERLYALRDKKLVEQGLIPEFFLEISDIIRQYLQGRLKIKIYEMTTEELSEMIKKQKLLSKKSQKILFDFFEKSDLVKFAAAKPAIIDAENAFKSALEFIEQSKLDDTEAGRDF